MYKERSLDRSEGRATGISKSELSSLPLDRKRINDALDKHLEKSSPSTSKGLNNGREKDKEKDRLSIPSTSSASKHPPSDPRGSALSKTKCSDGWCLLIVWLVWDEQGITSLIVEVEDFGSKGGGKEFYISFLDGHEDCPNDLAENGGIEKGTDER
ncbi:hypothetical protein AMTR_s00002p00153430 [Amborella trichopoda]|uniref:Uncharacterized protein n=1 Tax=Amborella trichopoda TaxID=13333 RepID=W1P0G1_AMBTC|nr:hypothetical protein AMTR_s00002p00153430 [Amborella trichopoda]